MDNSNIIFKKLELFIKKFYTNELIRGIIFFVGLGLLYFFFTVFIEYFLWLKPIGRTFLFSLFVGVEVFLFIRFILFPLFQLFRIKKGIDFTDASRIIGNHFPEINDKLTNFIQLSSDINQSELLIASINQKANSFQPIPFGNAIDFKSNKKFLPLALLPILVLAFFYFSGNSTIISQSLNRVVHFKQKFSPPSPFQFVVLNPILQTEQNKDFTIRIKTIGEITPENITIFIDNESYFMEKDKFGVFYFLFEKPVSNILFHVEANTISSPEFELKIVAVPSISNFEMLLNFPSYLNRKPEIIKGNGNAIIPEGTNVSWNIQAISTQFIHWKSFDIYQAFTNTDSTFSLSKRIVLSTDYQIITSNNTIRNFEKLNYQLSVIKDQFPTITVNHPPDSLKVNNNYVLGQISDDYGLHKLQVVYYPKNKPEFSKRGTIALKNPIFDQFVFDFPGNLAVEQGVSYEYYFEVFDNDAPHNFKSTKSSVFSNRIKTDSEIKDQDLQQQNDNINNLSKSLKNQNNQFSDLDKLKKISKEKDNLDFKEQQKINDFIKKQNQQDKMMKDFAEKMKDNLDKTKKDKIDEFKQDLQKRLENVNKDLDKNKKLLDELKELNDKIKHEDLMQKMDQFKQTAKNQTTSLEQLVELTKKYYVQKKAEQIKDKLNKLSEKQEQLSNKEQENNLEKQEDINTDFDKIQEEIKDLDKDNKELKKPLDLGNDKEKEKSIDDDLKKASEDLKKLNKAAAKPKQKSAAKKMKQLSKSMEQSMEQDSKEQLEEDVAMLRQIIDNLLAFSFSQEDLMSKFKSSKVGSPAFNKNLKTQQDLKFQFKHIDDSLFAMSLRNPKIGEEITKEIGNAQYNLDKSTETFVEAQLPKGISHQQYVISSANKMANLLADILNNMQMSLSGMCSGKPKPGQGEGMQLPDIIKKQEGVGEKMKKAMQKGKKPGDGKEGEAGQSKPGASGSKGEQGQNGEDGEGDAKAIMEIYKEQQQLRESLQKELEKQGVGGSGQIALEQMKQLEKQLLNKGFKNESLQRILNIKQELLKLNTAIQEQGEENKRQSQTNKKDFNNQSKPLPAALTDYLNSIELLNRQSLPLHSNFNQKIQDYFKTNDKF